MRVWPPQDGISKTAPSRASGVARAFVGIVISAALWFGVGLVVPALLGLTFSVALLFFAVAAPRVHARVDSWLTQFAHRVGLVMTVILMAPVFFCVFMPFRFLARRGSRDAMARRFAPDDKSYFHRKVARGDFRRPF